MVQNIYADRVFSRHPSALWSLDETVSTFSPTALPATIALSSLYGYPTTSYGDSKFTAYYVGSDTTAANLAATNHGIPMVYGATNITTLYDVPGNSSAPSMIFPGFGFLNEDGKYKSITFETWIKIHNNSRIPLKLIGPIASSDGVYVGGPFIYLKIGNNVMSHYIGEWGRPMLLHVGIANNSAFMMINGEQVITMLLDLPNTDFAEKYDTNGKDQDWIGIYSPENLNPINVDNVSIYPYSVSVEDAKIRFVWGQSVDSPEVGGTKDAALPVIMDYSFSQYANNYSYPEKSDWQNGFIDNFESKNTSLTTPEYLLPKVIFKDNLRTLQDWYDFQETLNTATTSLSSTAMIDPTIKFRLNDATEWGVETYLSFPNFNITNDIIDAVYGVFEYSTLPATDEILFKIINSSGDYLSCIFDTDTDSVKYQYGNSSAVILTLDGPDVTANEQFACGVNIPNLINHPSAVNQMKSFFSNRKSLSLVVGGDQSFQQLFTGDIYRFGFCNAKNFSQISTVFEDGIVVLESLESTTTSDPVEILFPHFANYTLFGIYTHNTFALDIATYSYWQDYVPATVLGKNIKNASGEQEYALDFIQFNVDYPESELTSGSNVSTSTQVVRTYVYFSNGTKPDITTSDLSKSLINLASTKIVEPGGSWATEIYEVVDGSIVYLPTVQDFSQIYVNLRVEAKVAGILRNKIKVRNLQLAGQSLNRTQSVSANGKTMIGSKLSRNLYPYRTTSTGVTVYDNYKNPYLTYKGKTPYLYLTKNSGIQVLGSTAIAGGGVRGIEIPINESQKRFFLMDVLQFGVYYNKAFAASETEILTINIGGQNRYTVYVLGVGDNTKAVLYVKDAITNVVTYEVEIYIDGEEDPATSSSDSAPYITSKNWHFVTIKFDPALDFSKQPGALRISGPFLINNIAHYQISEEEYANRVTPSLWSEINNRDGGAEETWTQTISATYEPANATWDDIYASTTIPSLGRNAESVYRSYFGSSRVSSLETNIPFKTYLYSYVGYFNIGGTSRVTGEVNQNKTVPGLRSAINITKTK